MDNEMKKAVCAIARDESIYITEWIAHNKLIGFDTIIIYDNGSIDGMSEIIFEISKKIDIKHIPWPTTDGASPQLSAYNDCLQRFKNDFDFIAFIDIDEFLYPKNLNITSYLNEAPTDIAAIAVNQLTFGSANHDHYFDDYVTRRFNKCSSLDYSERLWFKSIVNPAKVTSFVSAHKVSISSGKYVYSDFSEVEFDERYNGATKLIISDEIQVNHYILKSRQEFFETKMKRGGVCAVDAQDRAQRYNTEFFEYRNQLINRETFTYPESYYTEMDKLMLDLKVTI
ncbi:hypothetical protein GNG29_03130 [Leclercia sp. Colony189]|nr:hypothetical protein GNG29_03130 [Leclercia sp. Colony189]